MMLSNKFAVSLIIFCTFYVSTTSSGRIPDIDPLRLSEDDLTVPLDYLIYFTFVISPSWSANVTDSSIANRFKSWIAAESRNVSVRVVSPKFSSTKVTVQCSHDEAKALLNTTFCFNDDVDVFRSMRRGVVRPISDVHIPVELATEVVLGSAVAASNEALLSQYMETESALQRPIRKKILRRNFLNEKGLLLSSHAGVPSPTTGALFRSNGLSEAEHGIMQEVGSARNIGGGSQSGLFGMVFAAFAPENSTSTSKSSSSLPPEFPLTTTSAQPSLAAILGFVLGLCGGGGLFYLLYTSLTAAPRDAGLLRGDDDDEVGGRRRLGSRRLTVTEEAELLCRLEEDGGSCGGNHNSVGNSSRFRSNSADDRGKGEAEAKRANRWGTSYGAINDC